MVGFDRGVQPFLAIGQTAVNRELRAMLVEVGVPDANEYRSHDMRRGHAEDLRLGGATLGQILRAGDWRSPAFLQYLDAEQLELDRTVEAHHADSDDE